MGRYSLTIHSDNAGHLAVITALAEIVTHHHLDDSGLPVNARYAIEYLLSQLEAVEFDDPDEENIEDYDMLYRHLERVAKERNRRAHPEQSRDKIENGG